MQIYVAVERTLYSLAWPDPIPCRGVIACSISIPLGRGAYTASNNAPVWYRVWSCKTSHHRSLHVDIATASYKLQLPSLRSNVL